LGLSKDSNILAFSFHTEVKSHFSFLLLLFPCFPLSSSGFKLSPPNGDRKAPQSVRSFQVLLPPTVLLRSFFCRNFPRYLYAILRCLSSLFPTVFFFRYSPRPPMFHFRDCAYPRMFLKAVLPDTPLLGCPPPFPTFSSLMRSSRSSEAPPPLFLLTGFQHDSLPFF